MMMIALEFILCLVSVHAGQPSKNDRDISTSELLMASNIEYRIFPMERSADSKTIVNGRTPINESTSIIERLTIPIGLSTNLCFKRCLAQLIPEESCSRYFKYHSNETRPLASTKFFIKNRTLCFNNWIQFNSVLQSDEKPRLKRNLISDGHNFLSKGNEKQPSALDSMPLISERHSNNVVKQSSGLPYGSFSSIGERQNNFDLAKKIIGLSRASMEENKMAKFKENSKQTSRKSRDLRMMSYRREDTKPHLLFTPIQQTVSPGSPVSMKCSAMGSPFPVISWTRDGNHLVPSLRTRIGSYILNHEVISFVNITSAMTRDGGTFSCLAANSVGSVVYSTRLNVYGPPFVRPMVNITAVTGKDVVVWCPVGGYPLPSLRWQFNGQDIATSMRVNILPNNTLQVRQIQVKDEGRYSCIATGRRRRTAMAETYIIIINPPVIEEFSFARDLLEGRRTHLTCMVTSGDLPISIKWMKNGRPLRHDPDLKQKLMSDYSMSLLFEKLDERHSGNYTCVTRNAASTTNYTAPLKVKFSPKWVRQPSDISLSVGASIRIECDAKGEPPPNIRWVKISQDSSHEIYDRLPNKQIHLEKGSLFFSKIKKNNAGSYRCEISNGIEPKLSKEVKINVNAGATIISPGGDISGPIGRSVEMVCEASGDKPIQVIWMKEYTRIMPSHRIKIDEIEKRDNLRSVLRLESLTAFDKGDYTCEAINRHGRKSQIFHLMVLEPPSALKHMTIADISSTKVKVTWNPEKKANYLLQYKETRNRKSWEESAHNVTIQENSSFYDLSHLKPYTAYTIRLFAMNDLGISPPSNEVKLHTKESAPSGQPKDVRVVSIEPRSFLVSWRSSDPSTHNGLLRGYIISIKEQNMEENVQHIVRPILFHDSDEIESYTIRGFAANSLYEIAIKVFNKAGHGPLSSPRVVQETLSEAPFCSPIGVFCKSDHIYGIRVWWETPNYACEHSRITGYSILATPTSYKWNRIAGPSSIEVTTTNLEKNLSELASNSNISIAVRSFNHFGFSPPSKHVFCQTSDDVPNRLLTIRATSTTDGSIIVSWDPQNDDQSVILKYTVYYEEKGRVNKVYVNHNGKEQSWQILKGFSASSRINVWVTVTSSAGESLPSDRVMVIFTSSATYGPIAIGTKRIVRASSNTAVTIGCTTFGVPHPTIEWYHLGKKVVSDQMHHLLPGGDLHVTAKESTNYTCKAISHIGIDSFVTTLEVISPPSSPYLKINEASHSSLNLSLSVFTDGGCPILGYIVHYRQNSEDWLHVDVLPNPSSSLLYMTIKDLKCGSITRAYAESWNAQGTSSPSKVASISTKGFPPPNPEAAKILAVNSSCSLLSLYNWNENGCAIKYWSVQIKSENSKAWNSIYDSLGRDTEDLALCDYSHHSDHYMRLTAFSEAGKTAVSYKIRFGRVEEGWISAEKIEEVKPETDELTSPWFDAHIIAGMLSSVLLTLAVVICIVVIVKRYHYDRKLSFGQKGEQSSFGSPTNDAIYHTIEKRENGGQGKIAHRRTKSHASLSSYNDDVCPYATFSAEKIEDTIHYGVSLYSNSDSPSSRKFFGNEGINKDNIYTYKEGVHSKCEGSEMLYIPSKTQLPGNNCQHSPTDLHNIGTLLVRKYDDNRLKDTPSRERTNYIKQKLPRPSSSYCETKRTVSSVNEPYSVNAKFIPISNRPRLHCNKAIDSKGSSWNSDAINMSR